MLDWIARLFDRGRWDVAELAQRLGVSEEALRDTPIQYRRFTIPKRRGGTRTILAPAPPLKKLQQRILRRLLARLRAHDACHGFERGRSIVTNARPHVGRRTVIRLDIQDFFASTSAERVERYFRAIGWKREAAKLLTALCTYEGGLRAGAPTSPRLANLVNYRLDARLDGAARRLNAVYTRYADDLTFSSDEGPAGSAQRVRLNEVISLAKTVLSENGYRLHMGRKLRMMRANQRQVVTGLVVNQRLALPRATRRWLRAVEHHAATGRRVTLTEQQRAGWHALAAMVDR